MMRNSRGETWARRDELTLAIYFNEKQNGGFDNRWEGNL
jgi:hypothetical protein